MGSANIHLSLNLEYSYSLFHVVYEQSSINEPAQLVQLEFNMGSTRAEVEMGEKPMGWVRVGHDGLQFGLGLTQARDSFCGFSLDRPSTRPNQPELHP